MTRILLFFFSLLFTTILSAQGRATEDKALITVLVKSEEGKALGSIEVLLRGAKMKEAIILKTSSKGEVHFLIDNDDEYIVRLKGSITEASFALQGQEFLEHTMELPYKITPPPVENKTMSKVEDHGLKPSETKVLLDLRLVDWSNRLLQEGMTVKFEGEKSGDIVEVSTNTQSKVFTLLNRNEWYFLHLPNAPYYYKIFAEDYAHLTMQEQVAYGYRSFWEKMPRVDSFMIAVRFKDIDSLSVEGEELVFYNAETNELIKEIETNANGVAHVYLPFGKKVYAGSKYHPKAFEFDTKLLEGNILAYKDLEFTSLSKEARAIRNTEKDRIAAELEALIKADYDVAYQQYHEYIKLIDGQRSERIKEEQKKRREKKEEKTEEIPSVEDKIEKDEFAEKNQKLDEEIKKNELVINAKKNLFKKSLLPAIHKDVKVAEVLFREKAEAINNYQISDFNFYTKNNKSILAVMDRNRAKWPNLLIVTDITVSMYRALEEILLWHVWNVEEHEKVAYLFFNDGDQSTTKKVGKTGGLHWCISKANSFQYLAQKLAESMRKGGGGDAQENDVEALLSAVYKKGDNQEILLIADGNSRMRDISLLYKMKTPVHVIISARKNHVINEEYLTLAYQTDGSIHTLEEDFENLRALKDQAVLKIAGYEYKLVQGEFIKW